MWPVIGDAAGVTVPDALASWQAGAGVGAGVPLADADAAGEGVALEPQAASARVAAASNPPKRARWDMVLGSSSSEFRFVPPTEGRSVAATVSRAVTPRDGSSSVD